MRRLLVVEDQEDIQALVRMTLEASKRFAVQTAATGQDAITKAVAEPPDVVLLDYSLPDMDGPEVFAALRAGPSTAHIPVIFLTALSDTAQLQACREQGALGIIGKPFSVRALADQIETLLAQAR